MTKSHSGQYLDLDGKQKVYWQRYVIIKIVKLCSIAMAALPLLLNGQNGSVSKSCNPMMTRQALLLGCSRWAHLLEGRSTATSSKRNQVPSLPQGKAQL